MKNVYKIRLVTAGIIFTLAILGIAGLFYPVKVFDLQFLPLFQRVITDFSVIALLVLLFLAGLTFFCGRIYCSTICPFGIVQEIIGFVKNRFRKNKCTPQANFPLKYFVAAITWGILIGGSAIAIRYIEPYTLFGSALSHAAMGITGVIIILAVVLLKDRIFCTNFCPVGTVLGLVSKFSLNKIYMTDDCLKCGMCERNCPSGCINSKEKIVDNETCIKCLKCIDSCSKDAVKYGIEPKKAVKFNLKRREIIIAAAAFALFGGMIKAGIELKEKITEKIKDVILPPGADNKEKFFNKCLNCNLCVENCPNKIIKKANSEYGAVHLDYSEAPCKFDCNKCSQVCPTGAIKRINLEEKQRTRIAMAMIKDDKCSACGLCAEACPTRAIITVEGKTVLNAAKCIGCGACKNACHFSAIEIFPIKEQKTI